MKKSQQDEFVYKALPGVFHSDPQGFINYLTRDGKKFLQFWWDYVAKTLKEEDLVSSQGINYHLRELDKNTTLVLITLPRHPEVSDAYYMALYQPRTRLGVFLKRALTRVVILEYKATLESADFRTILAEITPGGRRVVIGPGPEPRIENFFETVCKLIYKKEVSWKAG